MPNKQGIFINPEVINNPKPRRKLRAEEKMCPMKLKAEIIREIGYECDGKFCAWWVPYDEDVQARIGENGRCALCAINANLSGIAAHTGNI